jgi:hypothetical protein
MKTIAQIYETKTQALEGKLNSPTASRAKLEAFFEFWTTWLACLNPMNSIPDFFDCVNDIFTRKPKLYSEVEILAGLNMLREHLRIPHLRLTLYYKLRNIMSEACEEAKKHSNVDVALCALMTFVQLESGVEPDSEYGQFPLPRRAEYRFNDADLSDNPIEAEQEIEMQADRSEDFGTSEYLNLRWFCKWQETIEDAVKFERAFPGAGHRRENVLRAVQPIFERLDPILETYTLELFLRWTGQLLKNPLQEGLLGVRGNRSLDRAA